MRNIEACYFEASKCYKASEPRSGAIEAANASSSLAGPPAVERYQKRRYQEHVRAPVDIFACGAIRWLLAPSSEGERGGAGLEGVSARGDLLRSEMSRSRRLILSIYRGSSLTQLFIRRECRLRSRGGALSLSPARSQARTRGEATGRRRRKRRRGGWGRLCNSARFSTRDEGARCERADDVTARCTPIAFSARHHPTSGR